MSPPPELKAAMAEVRISFGCHHSRDPRPLERPQPIITISDPRSLERPQPIITISERLRSND